MKCARHSGQEPGESVDATAVEIRVLIATFTGGALEGPQALDEPEEVPLGRVPPGFEKGFLQPATRSPQSLAFRS